jgi:hypothetical protein
VLDALDDDLVEALQHLLQLSHMASDPALWDVFATLAARVRPVVPELALLAQVSHPVRCSAQALQDFDHLIAGLGPEPIPCS